MKSVSDGSNFAYKGIAVRLDPGQGGVSRGKAWVVYDHDTLRLAAAWTGQEFIDWNGINFNGRHQVHPRIAGEAQVANPNGPGWANPGDQSFDRRPPPRSGRQILRSAATPLGALQGALPSRRPGDPCLYRRDDRCPGDARASRSIPAHSDNPIFTRTLEIGPSSDDLTMRVAPEEVAVSLVGDGRANLQRRDGFILLRVPGSESSRVIKVLMSSGAPNDLQAYAKSSSPGTSLEPLTHGGPTRWPEILKTRAVIGRDDGPLAVDVLTVPDNNPWLCQMRLSGFDFMPDGHHAAVCTWDGDVWLAGGIDRPSQGLTWRRIASGLFQPLGLKIVAGRIYVGCRDQIVCLHDLNGDGETDFYENFNSDHQVTEHFHEFAMGLQTDAEGNFYYAKAARHGLPAVVPHHGTLLKVSKDGMRTEILATGFRAPNGVCLNPDGTFFLSDQEGFWTPKNRINWVKRGGFYGNMWGYHNVTDSSDSAMEQPVCWITNAIDRSPAELVWVESKNPAWEPLRGRAAQSLLWQRQDFRGAARGRGRSDARRGLRFADSSVADRRDAGAISPGRRSALHLRPVRLGRRPNSTRRFLPGARHRQAHVFADWLERAESPPGNHFHGTARPEKCLRPGTLHGQDLVAEADRQLRLRPPRRTTGPDHQGHALRRWPNRLAGNP